MDATILMVGIQRILQLILARRLGGELLITIFGIGKTINNL